MGAALAGAHPIIAVDVEDAKLEQAREVGATHAVRGDGDVAAAVRAIVPGGADYAFEAIGLQRTIELMPDLICLGGSAVMVGMTPEDVRVSFSGFGMAEYGHSVLGSNYGSSVAPIDFPRIAALYEAGKLPIDRLITRRSRSTRSTAHSTTCAPGAVAARSSCTAEGRAGRSNLRDGAEACAMVNPACHVRGSGCDRSPEDVRTRERRRLVPALCGPGVPGNEGGFPFDPRP